MREQGILTRRALAAALPLAALARASTSASAAVPAGISAGGDAALLDLGRRWQTTLAAEQAESLIDCDGMSPAEADACNARCEALHEEVSELFDQIMQTPATTLAGLAVKARILAYENDVQEPDEASIEKALVGAHYFEDLAAFSLALDVLWVARATS